MNIKEALLELREEALSENVEDERCGICFNIGLKIPLAESSYRFVEEYCIDWEHFSGIVYYPVPEDEDVGFWEGVN